MPCLDKRIKIVNNINVGREPLALSNTKDSFYAPYGLIKFNAITAIENASNSIIILSTIDICPPFVQFLRKIVCDEVASVLALRSNYIIKTP